MAKITYIGNGTSHKVKKIYISDGSSKKVKKGYIGENNLSKLFFSGETRWERYSLVTQYKWNRYNLNYTPVQNRPSWNDPLGWWSTSNNITFYAYSGTSYTMQNGGFVITNPERTVCDGGVGGSAVGASWGFGRGAHYVVASTVDRNFGTKMAYGGSDMRFSIGEQYNSSSGSWIVVWSFNDFSWIYTLSTTQGSLVGTVTSTQSNTYPSNGTSGNYWYTSIGSEQIKGSLVDVITSDNENAYPDNGISGNYWYVKIQE